MQPFFITSSVDGITYLRGEYISNNPVNLSACTSISKTNFAWYPDNIGRPSITFAGCDCKWVYEDEKQRDLDFARISSNKFLPLRKIKDAWRAI